MTVTSSGSDPPPGAKEEVGLWGGGWKKRNQTLDLRIGGEKKKKKKKKHSPWLLGSSEALGILPESGDTGRTREGVGTGAKGAIGAGAASSTRSGSLAHSAAAPSPLADPILQRQAPSPRLSPSQGPLPLCPPRPASLSSRTTSRRSPQFSPSLHTATSPPYRHLGGTRFQARPGG